MSNTKETAAPKAKTHEMVTFENGARFKFRIPGITHEGKGWAS